MVLLDFEDRSRGVNGYEDSRASEFQAFGGDGLKEFPGLLRRLPAEFSCRGLILRTVSRSIRIEQLSEPLLEVRPSAGRNVHAAVPQGAKSVLGHASPQVGRERVEGAPESMGEMRLVHQLALVQRFDDDDVGSRQAGDGL